MVKKKGRKKKRIKKSSKPICKVCNIQLKPSK